MILFLLSSYYFVEENNFIEWTKDYFLKWSDFQAESNPSSFEDSSSKIRYHPTWTVDSEMFEGQIYFMINDINLTTQFLKHLSWVRENYASDNLLKHEQGHFDLAELLRPTITEKLQNEFKKRRFPTRGQNDEQRQQFAREQSAVLITKELEKWFNCFTQQRTKYDADTEFGQNSNLQKEYDEKFKALRN